MDFDIRILRETKALITHYLRQTPIVPSHSVPGMWFKAENLQVTGSFKIRTALSQMLKLSKLQRDRGIVTSSSGNFASAAAWAAHRLGITAKIVMMRSSNPVKTSMAAGFGAEIAFCGNSFRERQEMVREIAGREGRTVIYPFDHPEAVNGNATLGMEILEQLDRVQRIIVPVSGGGLISGIALTVKLLRPEVRIIGVQPHGSNATFQSFHQKDRIILEKSETIADGLRVTEPGTITFPLIRELVDDMVEVSEDAIRQATRLLIFTEKLTSEPSGAVPLAAVLEDKVDSNASVAVISGGNIDPTFIAELAEEFRESLEPPLAN